MLTLSKNNRRWLIFFLLILVLYAVFSFGLVVPNLVLSSNGTFWQFQQFMWQLFYEQRQVLSLTYVALLILMWFSYFGLMLSLYRSGWLRSVSSQRFRYVLPLILLAIAPLLLSYNALSADVFNYIFNAKMVVTYHADPHVLTAQDFPTDPMVRFMHNSHTPAPYGRVWTYFSIPFYLLGANKFILQWFVFRLLAVVSVVLTAWIIWRFWQHRRRQSFDSNTHPLWLFLNPLLLIEIVSNQHNDLWMVGAAAASLYLVAEPILIAPGHFQATRAWHKIFTHRWVRIILSALVLIFSIQIKFASLVVIPFWLYLVFAPSLIPRLEIIFKKNYFSQFINWLEKYFFDLLALAFFVPLLLPRSQNFHPWYWTWVLAWWPLCHWSGTRLTIMAFALSSMLRYLPFLWTGNYEQAVLPTQKAITFIGAALLICLAVFLQKFGKMAQCSRKLKN